MDYLTEIQKTLKANGFKKTVTLKTDFRKLGMDSLEIMDMIITIENKFNVTFPDDRLLKIQYVSDLVDLLKEMGI